MSSRYETDWLIGDRLRQERLLGIGHDFDVMREPECARSR